MAELAHNTYVTLINRTQDTLTGTWDSKQYDLLSGKSEHPLDRAVKFKEQNPVMGSEDPRTNSIIYKIGVEELHDDCSPLTPEFLARFSGSIERWDRAKLVGARPTEVVAGDNGLYSRNDASPVGLPAHSNFVNPNS